MRFDDSLQTVLAADTASSFGAQSAWRQLTDLIGRGRAAPARQAIERLRMIRGQVPRAVRSASARDVARANPPADLVQLFAEDEPPIAALVLAGAHLSEVEWCQMLPALPPASRALLRLRRDLPAGVNRALESYGSSDFALPLPAGYEPEPIEETSVVRDVFPRAPAKPVVADFDGTGPFPIAELVARLDAYQRDHGDLNRSPLPFPVLSDLPVEHFCFETDATGTIRWVDGAPREPLVGVLLGAGSSQVDGFVTGAFRRRAPFANGRLVVAGNSSAAGHWQVSATPCFDPATGRFTGYRGVARRPRSDERAEPIRSHHPAAEALRALVHELRTPTTAISGFAQMIEGQVLGPAPDIYRERAGAIRTYTRDLLDAIDDVDTAARIEQNALELRPGATSVAALLKRAAADLQPLMDLRQSVVDIDPGSSSLTIAGDEVAVGRIVSRLMAVAIGASGIGERIAIKAVAKRDKVKLSIARPRAFAAHPGEQLLLLDSEDQGEGISLLGIGFALRLARNLAIELGGTLTIGEERLTLRLPAALDQTVGQIFSN